MSQGLCTSCGAIVNLAAGQEEISCAYCGTLVKRPEAEAQFAQFSEIKKNKFGGALLLAEIANEAGDDQKALKYYNKVVEQQMDFSEAWLNRGICLVRALYAEWMNAEDVEKLTVKKLNKSWAEAISSWKAAVRFAKDPAAMGKRLALEINNELTKVFNNNYLPDGIYDLTGR